MVQWINRFPDFSGPVGGLGAYIRVVTTNPNVARRAQFDPSFGVVLASGGMIDTNAPTRSQYPAPAAFMPKFTGSAAFRFDATDAANAGGGVMSARLYVAKASSVPANPTPQDIVNNAIEVTLAQQLGPTPASRTTAGDIDCVFVPASIGNYDPNTKYWSMICPTVNGVPFYGANTHGRGASLWTNRTPLAPQIISPVGQTTTYSGQTVELKFQPRDPDRVTSFAGDSGIPDFEDMAGMQIQYRPRPTTANPDPAWADIPIRNLTATAWGRGWHIDGAPTGSDNDGAYYVWLTRRLVIKCGIVAGSTANSAELPAGDWQLRVRTFDYGHAYPDSANLNAVGTPDILPLGWLSPTYNPDNYPPANTSPWSDPVRILVAAQVPSPVPLSPVGNIAVVENTPVTLSWQYRNTYVPPFGQARRIVQIRHMGETGWFTLTDDLLASTSFTIGAGDLVSGNQYEWRVQVMDDSGTFSDYSEPVSFWVVPEPASGEVIPTPVDTVDTATLGCGTHRVMVYRRGGKVKVGELTELSSVEWNRLRDDISIAKVSVNGWSIDCGNLLAKLKTWAYELVIFRDNGFTQDRVWEGPITLLTYENDRVVIQAKDVMAYAYRRIVKQSMNDSGKSTTAGDKVTNRAYRVLANVFGPDDPNLLQYLHLLVTDDDSKQYRNLPAYSKTAYEEVDDMAANAGLDYTAVGRSILLWSTKHRIGTLPEMTDKDLGASPIVSEYGMSMANVYAVSDGNGIWGEATRLDDEGKDETYGLVEMLSSTWASDSAVESGTYTQEGINTIRESFAKSAERSIADRYPPPVVVRVPDNTTLNPDIVLSIQHLVPGVVIPLRSTSTLRQMVASQKLDAVKVIETGGKETISITMSPFSRDDNEPEEGEG